MIHYARNHADPSCKTACGIAVRDVPVRSDVTDWIDDVVDARDGCRTCRRVLTITTDGSAVASDQNPAAGQSTSKPGRAA